MHFQQFGNSTKCRLTRPEHHKWASVPWPSWRPSDYSFQKHVLTPSSALRLSHSPRVFLRLAGGQILPPLCFVARLSGLRVLLCSPDNSIFKIKVNKRRPWPGSNPPLNVYVKKGLCFGFKCFNENRQLWEELVRLGHHCCFCPLTWTFASPSSSFLFKGLALSWSHIFLDDKLIKLDFLMRWIQKNHNSPRPESQYSPSGSD